MSEWFNSITHAISKIIVKSVVDSLGKVMLLAFVVVVIAVIFVKDTWVLITLFCFPGFLLLIYSVSHFYCLFTNPDLLRSEEYNIKKQSIELLGDKDNYKKLDLRHIVDIANPYDDIKLIEEKGGDDE